VAKKNKSGKKVGRPPKQKKSEGFSSDFIDLRNLSNVFSNSVKAFDSVDIEDLTRIGLFYKNYNGGLYKFSEHESQVILKNEYICFAWSDKYPGQIKIISLSFQRPTLARKYSIDKDIKDLRKYVLDLFLELKESFS